MPLRQQIHVDKPLTNISVAYAQSADAFIADKVFPVIGVQKQSDTYFEYDRDDFFRDEAQERAKGTESAGSDYNIEVADPYFARVYAFHVDVNEQDRVNADDPLRPDQDATEFVTHKLLLKRENLWAQKFFKAGVWGTEFQGVDSAPTDGQVLQLDQPAADPVRFFNKISTQAIEATGYKPNTMVLTPYVYNALINNEDILDRIKYTEKGIATLDLLASLFEVDQVYVPWAIQNTEAKGKQGKYSFMLGKHALMMYVEKNPGLKKPSAGYTFAWTGLMGAGAYGNRITRIPMPWLGHDTERIEGEMAFDHRVVGADLGIFLKDLVK
ncbi:hypothetical protein D3C76_169790 [compost metagenome]